MTYEYKTKRKIEFADTDLAGICHFARFFIFMETTEHQFLNYFSRLCLKTKLGISYIFLAPWRLCGKN